MSQVPMFSRQSSNVEQILTCTCGKSAAFITTALIKYFHYTHVLLFMCHESGYGMYK